MKKFIALACFGFAVSFSTAVLAGAQQEKMKGCNKEARADDLKGDARRAFMSKCLKKDYTLKAAAATPEANPEAAAIAPAGQQSKMKTCNADAGAKGLKGDERRAFMKTCLKG